jgi:hypothetical protein
LIFAAQHGWRCLATAAACSRHCMGVGDSIRW